VCMKVCPIQRYGMAAVMEHYVATGEVLGKGTDSLEGYTLPDKGYFGPGQLPQFNAQFFNMPHGKAEDWLMIEFRQKLETLSPEERAHDGDLWTAFRQRVEASLSGQSASVDMGMDAAIDRGI